MDVDLLQVGLVHVGVVLDRLDELRDAVGRVAQVVGERARVERARHPAHGVGRAAPAAARRARRATPRRGRRRRAARRASRRPARRAPRASSPIASSASAASSASRGGGGPRALERLALERDELLGVARARRRRRRTRPIAPSSMSSASPSAAAVRRAAAAGLLSSCARPADIWPSAASFSRCSAARLDARRRPARTTRIDPLERGPASRPAARRKRSARDRAPRGWARRRGSRRARRRRSARGSRRCSVGASWCVVALLAPVALDEAVHPCPRAGSRTAPRLADRARACSPRSSQRSSRAVGPAARRPLVGEPVEQVDRRAARRR